MAALEVIALDTATPQLRAPGASDTYTFPRAVEMPLGTANGVLYLNGSKVVSSGSGLTFDGTNLLNDQSTASPIGLRLRNGSASTSAGARITFEFGGSTTGYVGNQFDGSDFNNQYSASRHHIWFNGGSEQMRLTSTGLGIGTSSPAYKLDVVGSGTPVAAVRSSATGDAKLYLECSGTNSGYIAYNRSLQALTFSANNVANQAILDASGNLGLGVTPSAWSSVFKAMEFAAAGSVSAISDELGVNANSVYLTGTNWTYKASGFASQYRQSSGQHKWFTAPSGTAGNAISFTQALTLDASRNLALNTTSVGTSAVGVLSIGSGTEPSSGPADTVQFYSVDRSAGNTIPAIYCEGSGVTNAGITNVTVTNKIAIKVNGTVYYLLATTNAT